MRHAAPPALLAACALALTACGDSAKPTPASNAARPIADASTRFPIGIAGKTLRMRLALTELEQATGLMGTTGLPPDEGMLFAYRDAAPRAFWMANVPYDIDLGHFDADGRLDETQRLRANDTTTVPSRANNIRYVVEAPAGWFQARGIRPGDRLDLAALANAIHDRGFPEKAFVAPIR